MKTLIEYITEKANFLVKKHISKKKYDLSIKSPDKLKKGDYIAREYNNRRYLVVLGDRLGSSNTFREQVDVRYELDNPNKPGRIAVSAENMAVSVESQVELTNDECEILDDIMAYLEKHKDTLYPSKVKSIQIGTVEKTADTIEYEKH